MAESTISKHQASRCAIEDSELSPPAGEFAPFVVEENGHCRIDLHVGGVHCAKCIWVIESTLQQQPEVTACRVNMSSARLSISWQGTASAAAHRADGFAGLVKGLGYQVSALQPEIDQGTSESSRLLRYTAVAGFATGNIMLISVALWSSELQVMGLATRELLHWVSAAIALPTVLYSGRPFFRAAIGALKAGHTNMDVPISLALLLASGMSVHETIIGGEHAYFDSAVMLLFFLLIGRWLDAKARGKARAQATQLLSLLQGSATLIDDQGYGGDAVRRVMISELSAEDRILVAVGEKIPTDARVLDGISEVDTSLVTGESIPRQVGVGTVLYGGTVNLGAPLTCEIIRPSKDSLLANVVRLMEQAEQGRASYTRLADKAARLYTPVVHTLALLAFVGWFGFGGLDWQPALLIAITTLIITCPCALGLAVPAVQVLAVEWLMKRGVLVKTADALEKLNGITTVVFDKTGTLTQGKPRLVLEEQPERALKIAASLADYSCHPLSRAISASYTGERHRVSDVGEIPGVGLEGSIDGHRYHLGKSAQAQQQLTVSLKRDGEEWVCYRFEDQLRDDARATVSLFKHHGIPAVLLSGDHQAIATKIANSLGIGETEAEKLPDAKLAYLQDLQQRGKLCLMVGDGLNDAPALAQAHVSISPSTGMDITQNTADLVFRRASLKAVFAAWQCARFSTRLVKQNFALAALYNCCAIPLAVMGYVTPLVAAIAMSSSSLVVIGNAFRIRWLKES